LGGGGGALVKKCKRENKYLKEKQKEPQKMTEKEEKTWLHQGCERKIM
jgi:hypothetical protein